MTTRWVKDSIILGLFAKLSRILGMVRDNLCGSFFGTSFEFGAFALAFRLPDLFRRLIEEGVLSSAILPSLQDEKDDVKEHKIDQYSSQLFTFFLSICFVLITISLIGISYFKHYQYTNDELITLNYSFILLPYIGVLLIIALLNSILYTLNQFFITAISPFIFNIFWILGIYISINYCNSIKSQIELMCYSIVIASFVQVIILFYVAKLKKWNFHFQFKYLFSSIKIFIKNVLPIMINLSVYQIMILIGGVLLIFSQNNEHDLAALYYADRIQQLPFGIFALAITTSIYPTLTKLITEGQLSVCSQQLYISCRLIWFFVLPATIGICVLHENIVIALFSFKSVESVHKTSSTLLYFNFGLLINCTAPLLTRAVYAYKSIRFLNILTFSILSAFSVVVVFLLILKIINSELVALTISFFSLIQIIFILYHCQKHQLIQLKQFTKKMFLLLLPSLIMLLCLVLINFLWRLIIQKHLTSNELQLSYLQNLYYLGTAILFSVFIYFYSAKLLRSDEWIQIKDSLNSK